jgi:hypothetical protein
VTGPTGAAGRARRVARHSRLWGDPSHAAGPRWGRLPVEAEADPPRWPALPDRAEAFRTLAEVPGVGEALLELGQRLVAEAGA